MQIELKVLDNDLYPTIRRMAGKCEFPDTIGLPYFATSGSCAMDLKSAEDITLLPGERRKIKTGLAIWIGGCKKCKTKNKKYGVAGLILPRSGLGTRGLVLANTAGLIDEDYQGELIISVWNSLAEVEDVDDEYYCGSRTFAERHNILEVSRGDRIAQLMFTPVIRPIWKVVNEFSDSTSRGEGGFNSTGNK